MIRILLAEDQRMVLGALGSLLNLESDMDVIGMARNGQEALALVESEKPDVLITDIEMPVMTGLDTAEQLAGSSCKVIILTTFARAGYFDRARKAGVSGYLLKDSPIEDLASAIRQVVEGRRVYAPELVDMMYSNENPLTERESQVLELVAEGKTTREIALALSLTAGTVRNYISAILDKLEVTNRIEAITRFKDRGWLK